MEARGCPRGHTAAFAKQFGTPAACGTSVVHGARRGQFDVPVACDATSRSAAHVPTRSRGRGGRTTIAAS